MSEKPACSAISVMRLLLSRASVSNVVGALQAQLQLGHSLGKGRSGHFQQPLAHQDKQKISQPLRVGFWCTKPTHCVRNRPRSLLNSLYIFESARPVMRVTARWRGGIISKDKLTHRAVTLKEKSGPPQAQINAQ